MLKSELKNSQPTIAPLFVSVDEMMTESGVYRSNDNSFPQYRFVSMGSSSTRGDSHTVFCVDVEDGCVFSFSRTLWIDDKFTLVNEKLTIDLSNE